MAVLAKNSTEFQEIYFAAGRAGLVVQPLNWRLGVAELARIVADGAPRAIVVAGEWADAGRELATQVDVEHWLSYGPGGDGSYEDLLAASSDDEPTDSASVGDDDPFFILYTGGTTGASKGALHTHRSASFGMLNQTVAERIVPDRRLHADRADVPHPGRALDELHAPRLPAGAHELRGASGRWRSSRRSASRRSSASPRCSTG